MKKEKNFKKCKNVEPFAFQSPDGLETSVVNGLTTTTELKRFVCEVYYWARVPFSIFATTEEEAKQILGEMSDIMFPIPKDGDWEFHSCRIDDKQPYQGQTYNLSPYISAFNFLSNEFEKASFIKNLCECERESVPYVISTDK